MPTIVRAASLFLVVIASLAATTLPAQVRPPHFVGIEPGGEVPSFLPWHLTGPHAGRTACPLCVYGQRPGVAIWARPDGLAAAATLAAELDRTIEPLQPWLATGYVVYVPAATATREAAERELRLAFAAVPLHRVFLVIADRRGNADDLAKYGLDEAAGVRTTTVAYVNRRAVASWQDLERDAAALAGLPAMLARLGDAEEPYRESAVRLAPEGEPGEALEFHGRVLDENGKPLARASVIAYGTDATGRYVRDREQGRNPRLRGVAVTDDQGWYRFATVRPGPYPGTKDPAHIHLHIDAAVHQHLYRTIWFEGDPRITPALRNALDAETVIVPLRRRSDGAWTFRHDIRLAGS